MTDHTAQNVRLRELLQESREWMRHVENLGYDRVDPTLRDAIDYELTHTAGSVEHEWTGLKLWPDSPSNADLRITLRGQRSYKITISQDGTFRVVPEE